MSTYLAKARRRVCVWPKPALAAKYIVPSEDGRYRSRRHRPPPRSGCRGGGRPRDGRHAPALEGDVAPPLASPAGRGKPTGPAILEVRNLSVVYGSTKAVDDVSFQVVHGEIFGLLGPNGAGKTSTLSSIEGLVKPRAGSVLLDGFDVQRRPSEAKARMGVQLQATSFQSQLTIRQIVQALRWPVRGCPL